MKKKWIYLVRHGETDYNRLGRIQGSGIDAPLNETGRRQAKAFYDKYADTSFDYIYTSSLRRTLQTVEPFLEKSIPHHTTPLINEISWGIHEGRESDPDMKQTYREMVNAWGEGDLHMRLEGGESAHELRARLENFLEVLKKNDSKRILVCSHGRAIRCLMCLFRDEPMSHMEKYTHANTGLFLLRNERQAFTVLLENDTSHLPDDLI